ncbi:MAG: GAF domain-containing protein [Proteobacteria bacterium]|nr:GAF domain-containing protein [Pseudomonadota bacterium]
MYEIDVLGSREKESDVLARVLLAESDDPELNRIVREAAEELSAPMALVTLVLEHVQLFQAHFGLPLELATARATERSVSFCQFVVRDGEPFEVVNAAEDQRIPQALVERYGIMAYLGVPIRVEGVVVGSLCVLDTKARGFDETHHTHLIELGGLVTTKLASLAERRRGFRASLSRRALVPGLAELADSVGRISSLCAEAQIAAASVESCHRMLSYAQAGGTTAPEALEASLRGAIRALTTVKHALIEIECNSGEVVDCGEAIASLVSVESGPRLSDVLHSAQDLSRGPCRAVGGAPVPFFSDDPRLATGMAESVSTMAAAMVHVAQRMSEKGLAEGLQIRVEELDSMVVVSLSAPGFDIQDYRDAETAAGDLSDPALRVRATDERLCVSMAKVRPGEAD